MVNLDAESVTLVLSASGLSSGTGGLVIDNFVAATVTFVLSVGWLMFDAAIVICSPTFTATLKSSSAGLIKPILIVDPIFDWTLTASSFGDVGVVNTNTLLIADITNAPSELPEDGGEISCVWI